MLTINLYRTWNKAKLYSLLKQDSAQERLSLINSTTCFQIPKKTSLQISFFSWKGRVVIPGERNANANDNIFSLLASHLTKTDNREEIEKWNQTD